jgi:hypothetical protein
MKTGGATFRQHVYDNFRAGEVYPSRLYDADMNKANTSIEYLLGIPQERRDLTRAYTGHFPYVVSELLGDDFVTLTILRDPIERTISYLRHCKRYHTKHSGLRLEEIYEDPFYFPCFIHNHQSKIFAMEADDALESYMDVIDVDERRLRLALANLEQVDVLGLTEHQPELVHELAQRFGWRFRDRPDRRVSDEGWDVSRAFRRRIAADNEADIAFFDHARRLYEERRRAHAV